MTRTSPCALRALAWLLAAASSSLSCGCALVTDLNGDPYRLAEAGVCEGGGADASCTLPGIVCARGCPSGLVCCLTPSSNPASVACVAPSACAAQGSTSFQLCTPDSNDCPQSASCTGQVCKLGGAEFMEFACAMITGCTTL